MKSIIIFGAGIAGLSTAHDLIQLGYSVAVYEFLDQPAYLPAQGTPVSKLFLLWLFFFHKFRQQYPVKN